MILTWKTEQENNRVIQHPEAGSKSESSRPTGGCVTDQLSALSFLCQIPSVLITKSPITHLLHGLEIGSPSAAL